jgi:hypothetical protein
LKAALLAFGVGQPECKSQLSISLASDWLQILMSSGLIVSPHQLKR